MSHWAEINLDNKVIRILVGDNNMPDEGESFFNSLGGTWIKTSYTGKIRGTYAGIGYSYNLEEDIFIAPQPFPSWIRNGSFWESPIPKPQEGEWEWNEEEGHWNAIS